MPTIIVPIDSRESTLDSITAQCRISERSGQSMTLQETNYCKTAYEMRHEQNVAVGWVLAVAFVICALLVWATLR